jgi:hypothetical protein
LAAYNNEAADLFFENPHEIFEDDEEKSNNGA